jgi:hypothetical protein
LDNGLTLTQATKMSQNSCLLILKQLGIMTIFLRMRFMKERTTFTMMMIWSTHRVGKVSTWTFQATSHFSSLSQMAFTKITWTSITEKVGRRVRAIDQKTKNSFTSICVSNQSKQMEKHVRLVMRCTDRKTSSRWTVDTDSARTAHATI